MLKLFRKNKIFRDAVKYTSVLPTDLGFAPQNIYLTVSECLVSVGSSVAIGDCVGKNEKGVSVFSGISGKVIDIKAISKKILEINIKNDFEKKISGEVLPFGKRNAVKITDLTPEILVREVEAAGINTRGRQISQTDRTLCERITESFGKAKQMVVNCVCGEPYDSASDRVMLENPLDIINGMKIIMCALKIGEGFILLDTQSKAQANSLFREIKEGDNIKVILADAQYPSDSEHLIIHALTSIELSTAKNAERLACAIFDWREVFAIGRAFVWGERETGETVTVSGDVSEPMNLRIPYGTKISDVITYCGDSGAPETRIIVGGLLRGREVSDKETFESGMSPIIVLDEENIPRFEGQRCIRCGACAQVCPMMLMPMYLGFAATVGSRSLAKVFDISACIECGACQYVCSSEIPILANIRKIKKNASDGGEGK